MLSTQGLGQPNKTVGTQRFNRRLSQSGNQRKPLPSWLPPTERSQSRECSGTQRLTCKCPAQQPRHVTKAGSPKGSVKTATQRYDLPGPALAVRNLVEQVKLAYLSTTMSVMHHRRAGFPYGTFTEFASDDRGHPIFSFLPLATHTNNIRADSRCTLVVQLPGWSGLANAKATFFGDVFQLPDDKQTRAKQIFNRKHASEDKEGWVTGNNTFFRMHHITDIYFEGGFGTRQWLDLEEYSATKPDRIVLDNPFKTLQILNDTHAESLKKVLSRANQLAEDAAFISIDHLGTDVRVRHGNEYQVERLGFNSHVENLEEALAATSHLLTHGKMSDVLVA